jgi:hypothetical protein
VRTILREGETGVRFDLANNEHVPCGITKQIYLEDGGLHVTDSRHDITISFAISRKKLLRVGLALVFAACLDLRGILLRNILTIKALGQGRSPQSGQGSVDDRKDITAVACAALSLEEAQNSARDDRYVRTRPRRANVSGSTPAAVNSSEEYLLRRLAASRPGRNAT